MMKRKVLVVLLAGALIFAFGTAGVFAAGAQEDDGVVTIGYTPSDWDPSDFHGMFGAGVEERLTELYGADGYEFIIRAAGDHTQHEDQLSIAEDFVAQGVDFVVINPTDYEAQQVTYRFLNQSGMPFIVGNYRDPFPEDWGIEQPVQFVGYSHEDAGIATAEWIRDTYPEGTKIAIIHGSSGYTTYARSQVPMLREFGMDIVYEGYADFQRPQAYDEMERIVTGYPDAEVIITTSSAMAIGAVEAAVANDHIENVDILGAGGTIEELLAIEDGRMRMAWARDNVAMGNAAGQTIYDYMTTGSRDGIAQVFDSPIRIIDSVDAINQYINPVLYEVEGLDFPR